MPARKKVTSAPAVPYDKATFHQALREAETLERLEEVWALAQAQGYAPAPAGAPPAGMHSAYLARRKALSGG